MKLLRENHHWFRIFRKEEEKEKEEEKDPRGGPAATCQTRTRWQDRPKKKWHKNKNKNKNKNNKKPPGHSGNNRVSKKTLFCVKTTRPRGEGNHVVKRATWEPSRGSNLGGKLFRMAGWVRSPLGLGLLFFSTRELSFSFSSFSSSSFLMTCSGWDHLPNQNKVTKRPERKKPSHIFPEFLSQSRAFVLAEQSQHTLTESSHFP